MAEDGKTKATAKKKTPYDVETAKPAKKVTGLRITRSGNKFTATWTNAATYSSLKIKYRLKVGDGWQSWSNYTAIGASDTSRQFVTLDWGKYHPASGKPELHAIEVCVQADQANTAWEMHYIQEKKVWYKWRTRTTYTAQTETYTYDIKKPSTPKLTKTEGLNSTSFSYNVPNSEGTEQTVLNKVEYDTAWVKDWGTKSASSYSSWGSGSSSSSKSGSFANNHGAGSITAGQSYSVLARIRARGPEGDTDYQYVTVCYAWPLQAKGIAGTVSNRSTGYNITVKWDRTVDDKHPAPWAKVEYFIGQPAGTNLVCPSGAQWQAGTSDYENNTASKPTAVFNTNARISGEQFLWIRVIQKNVLQLETPSEPIPLIEFFKLKQPTISSVSYDATSNVLSVAVQNESVFSCQIGIYADGAYLGAVTGSGTLTVVKALAIGNRRITAGASYGRKTSDYAVMNFDPALSAANPIPYYPTGVSALKSAGSSPTVTVSWGAVLKGVTSSEITIADNPDEWIKANPDFIDTVTVSGSATSAVIGGLEFGATYYFKVRSTNANGTTGYSTSTGSVMLRAEDAPVPGIRGNAVETADHDIRVTWNWDAWASARQVQLTWSANRNDGDTDQLSIVTVDKKVSSGNQSYVIPLEKLERGKTWYIWARFVSDKAVSNPGEASVTLAIIPVAPTNVTFVRAAQSSDAAGQTTARLSWRDTWADTLNTILSWSTDTSAWEMTNGPETHEIAGRGSTILIPELELGKIYYARVRVEYDERYYAQSAALTALDLRTQPAAPVVRTSMPVVSQYGKMDVSWSYYNEDLSEQAAANIVIYDSEDAEVCRRAVAGTETAMTLYMEALGLTGDETYTVRVQTVSANNMMSDVSSAVAFDVINVPIAEITATSLVDETEEDVTVKVLTELPLTITVSGAEHNGNAFVYIERSKSIFLARPDESTEYGFEGELVATAEGGSDGQITIEQRYLHTDFTDGGEYRIVAVVTNEIGTKSDPVTLDFVVGWTHQAIIPEAEYEIDVDSYTARITPAMPDGALETDTFDIYRLSADAPELIVSGGTWDETYVDPYPAFGEHMGHRVVFRTETGDYTTAEGRLAWIDCIPPYDATEQPFMATGTTVIDFDGDRVEIEYNMDISHDWAKDFTETKYLGGSVQGDWNPAVSRTGTINGVMVTYEDEESITKMKRLAAFPGICHVRTPDGSSFAANVEVSESRSYDTGGRIAAFTLNITRVDSEVYEGMTLAEWEGQNGMV